MSLEKWRLPSLTKPLPSWLARWDKIALWALCCLSGVALTSYFNPFLTTPMGCVLWMMSESSVELALCCSPDNRQETEIQTEDLV